jgi:hypothetical protein
MVPVCGYVSHFFVVQASRYAPAGGAQSLVRGTGALQLPYVEAEPGPLSALLQVVIAPRGLMPTTRSRSDLAAPSAAKDITWRFAGCLQPRVGSRPHRNHTAAA